MNDISLKSFSIKKADVWLLTGILAVSLVILFVFRLGRTQGSYAEISYDGEVVLQIPLSQNAEGKYYLLTEQEWTQEEKTQTDREEQELQSQLKLSIREFSKEKWLEEADDWVKDTLIGNYNVLVSQNGEVRMIQSNCPDQICVHHSVVSGTGENIICLPHKIVIEVTGGKEHELDGVVY